MCYVPPLLKPISETFPLYSTECLLSQSFLFSHVFTLFFCEKKKTRRVSPMCSPKFRVGKFQMIGFRVLAEDSL